MRALIESFVLAGSVLAIGLPMLFSRRKTVLSIIESGDIERIPRGRREAYIKKNIPAEDFMKQFEKENMNIQLKYPAAFAIGVAFVCFLGFLFMRSI